MRTGIAPMPQADERQAGLGVRGATFGFVMRNARSCVVEPGSAINAFAHFGSLYVPHRRCWERAHGGKPG